MQSLSGFIVGTINPLPDGVRAEIADRVLFALLTGLLSIAVAICSRSQDGSGATKCGQSGVIPKRDAPRQVHLGPPLMRSGASREEVLGLHDVSRVHGSDRRRRGKPVTLGVLDERKSGLMDLGQRVEVFVQLREPRADCPADGTHFGRQATQSWMAATAVTSFISSSATTSAAASSAWITFGETESVSVFRSISQ